MVLVFFVQHVWVQYSENRKNFNHWYVELVSIPYIFINYFLRVRILPYIILKLCLNVHYFFVNIFLDSAWFILHGLSVKWEKTVQRHSCKSIINWCWSNVNILYLMQLYSLTSVVLYTVQFSFVYKCFCVQASAQFPTNMRRCFNFV